MDWPAGSRAFSSSLAPCRCCVTPHERERYHPSACLDALGIQSIGFRILAHGKSLRHTSPVVVAAESDHRPAISRFSVSDLFAAYALAPRKGEYVLNVEDGNLAYLPEPTETIAKPNEIRAKAVKFSRARNKSHRRHTRHSHGDRLAA